jgi:phospholipid-binding lipoprotein MlaA
MRAASTFILAIAAVLSAPAIASAQDAAPAVPPVAAAPEAAAVAVPEPASAVSDPWEGFNRELYAVHDGIDRVVLEPVARGYRAITPSFFRTGVSNFLSNLRSPVIFANDVLQAEPSRAGTTVARFGVNTTVGVLGLFDVAARIGLEPHDEDFGQTLAVWGVDAGPYIFIPVLGPTNLRDGFGRIVDIFIDPLTYAEFEGDDTFRTSRTVLTGVSAREALLDTIDDIRANSLDPYVSIRTSYGLLRESAISNGESAPLPEFEELPESELQPTEPAPEMASPTISEAPSASAPSGSVQAASL